MWQVLIKWRRFALKVLGDPIWTQTGSHVCEQHGSGIEKANTVLTGLEFSFKLDWSSKSPFLYSSIQQLHAPQLFLYSQLFAPAINVPPETAHKRKISDCNCCLRECRTAYHVLLLFLTAVGPFQIDYKEPSHGDFLPSAYTHAKSSRPE